MVCELMLIYSYYCLLVAAIAKPYLNHFLRKKRKDANNKKIAYEFQVEEIVWNFWKESAKLRCPMLSVLFRDISLVQPTSAGAERVFSLMRHQKLSARSSEDYVYTQTMCRHNSLSLPSVIELIDLDELLL